MQKINRFTRALLFKALYKFDKKNNPQIELDLSNELLSLIYEPFGQLNSIICIKTSFPKYAMGKKS